MMEMTSSVQAFSKSVLIMMYICLLTLNGHAKKVCTENEYYQPVLQDCLPCEDICKPLTRSDCERLCKAFYQRQTECQVYQYWEKYLKICLNCSDICVPVTRLDCKDRCQHYIDSLTTTTTTITTTTTTTTIEKPKHTENISPKQTVEGNQPGQSDVDLIIIIISLSALIGVGLIIVAICLWQKAKIKKFFRALLHINKTEKAPIQVTNDSGPNSLLLVNGQQSTV